MTARRNLMTYASAFCLLALAGCNMPPPDDGAPGALALDAGTAKSAQSQVVPQAAAQAVPQATSGPVTLGPAGAQIDLAAPVQPASALTRSGPEPSTLGPPAVPVAPPGDVNQRLDRLESQVADIRHTLDMMMPALTRLSLAQQNLQNVLTDIREGHARPAPAAKAAARPVVKPAGKPAPKPVVGTKRAPKAIVQAEPESGNLAHPPAAAGADDGGARRAQAVIAAAAAGMDKTDTGVKTGSETAGPPPKNVDVTLDQSSLPMAASNGAASSVNGIRIGEHGNMTRLVLDLTGRTSFTTKLDASGTLLTVRLPGTAWRTGAASTAANSRAVASYAATPDGQGGTILALRLKRAASVSWSDTLPPSGDAGYRAVIDLTPKG